MTTEEAFRKWRTDYESDYDKKPSYLEVWRAAIAYMQEQSEPFGIWHVADDPDECDFFLYEDIGDVTCEKCVKLYTTPQRQQPLKRLSLERVMEIYNEMGDAYITDIAIRIMDEMIRINK